MSTATDLVVHDDDAELVLVENPEAIGQLSRAEIDTQIATAKKWPRQITEAKRQALELATIDEETAATMFYVLPRGGKKLEGPSVRLAEVIGSSWGNLRYGARVIDVDRRHGFITAQGMCHDLEKNVAIALEIKRRITDKNGRIYNEDMIQVTGQAACSIALRNAIFRVVPLAMVHSIYQAAKSASIGKAETHASKRQKALEWYRKAGASEEQVFAFLGVKGEEDIGIDELIILRGLVTAIKDGETTVEQALSPKEDVPKVKASPVNEKLAKKPEPKPEPDEPAGEISPELDAILTDMEPHWREAYFEACESEKDVYAAFDAISAKVQDSEHRDSLLALASALRDEYRGKFDSKPKTGGRKQKEIE